MKQLLLIGGMIFFSVWSNAQLFNNQPSVMRGVLVDKTNNLKLEAAFITFDFGNDFLLLIRYLLSIYLFLF